MSDSIGPKYEWDKLTSFFREFPRSDRWLPALKRHAGLVEEWRGKVGLTSVPLELVVSRHYGESLEAWRLCGAPGGGVVVDVGAGAGFPGLVAAAVSPDTQVHLVESNRRRVAFLELAAREMGLGNVDVYALRAEEAGRGPLRETAQLVLARAVAPLRTLLEYAGPLCRPGGLLGFPKGTSAEIEIREAANACSELGIEFVERKKMRTEVSWTPWVVIFRKSGSTPDGYPRRSGVPGARPL